MTTHSPYDVTHTTTDCTFYWGVASGSSHAALYRALDDPDLPTPEHAMVSFATKENGLWPGPSWMVDCGGAPDSVIANNGHAMSLREYIDYLRDPPRKYRRDEPGRVDPDIFALRDWPCEPNVREELGMTVEECQERTLVDHIRLLDAVEGDSSVRGEPMAVLQGWEIHDYLECIDTYRDHGLVTDTIGLGSICRKNTPAELERVREIAQRVRANLPARVNVHGFGLKQTMLEHDDALRCFDSVDSVAWPQYVRHASREGVRKDPPGPGESYEDWHDWNDEGNPRCTWRNYQQCFAGYHWKLSQLRPAQVRLDDVVVSDEAWADTLDELPKTADDDGYVMRRCICGTLIDPGRPDPVPEPGCRQCEGASLRLWEHTEMNRADTCMNASDRNDVAVARV